MKIFGMFFGIMGMIFWGTGTLFAGVLETTTVTSKEQPGGVSSKNSKAYFAGGCFWGVEYLFEKKKGVLDARSGYMGGKLKDPTYQDVSYKNTGHVEVVEVEYDPTEITYEELAKLFFEIHDPTQKDGQGPDIGSQYLSVVFYNDEAEKDTAEGLIKILEDKQYKIATKLRKADTFWKAEEYHQDYYVKTKKLPYCHSHTKRF